MAGRVAAIGHPVKYGAATRPTRRPAPLLGQHTREVLTEAGYASAEIEALLRSGAAIAAG